MEDEALSFTSSPKGKGRRLGWLAAALVLVGTGTAVAFPPARPFDPRLLMTKVEARAKNQGQFRFVVLGDSKNNPPFTAVLEQAAALKPDLALSTGDLVDRGAGRHGAAEYDRLAEMAGAFMRRVPTWPVAGNHELDGGDATRAEKNFARFFGLRDENYAFDVGPARFIALTWPAPDAAGRAWLERQLAGARGRLIFVFQHNLYYTAGSDTLVKNAPDDVTRLFTRYGVTAVFQGHDHGYYRTRRDGVWYITSAGAGAQLYHLNRFREALPGDVFFGWAPLEGSPVGPDKYWLHRPGGHDRTYDSPQHFLVVVDVNGRHITARTVTIRGEELDALALTPPAGASRHAAAPGRPVRARVH
jgi:3',5'-cyclic AMP phosphodiesterase CpdA